MSAGRGPPSSCRCRERSWRVTHSRGHAPFTTAQACGYQGSSKRSARPFISLFPTRAPRPCGLPPDTIRGGVHRFDAREGGGFGISLTYYEPEHVRQDLGGHRHLGKEVCRIWSPTQGLWNRRVQVADPAFGGEMRIPVSFTDTDEGIEVAMSFRGQSGRNLLGRQPARLGVLSHKAGGVRRGPTAEIPKSNPDQW